MSTRLVIRFLLASLALVCADDAWSPQNGLQHLESLIESVHLAPEDVTQATQVIRDVSRDIEDMERTNMTGPQVRKRLGAAMSAMAAFEQRLASSPKTSSTKRQVLILRHRITGQQEVLKKAQEELPLMKLQMQLLEKKIILENLIAEKATGEISPEELDERKALIARLNATASLLSDKENATQGGQKKEQQIQETLTWLHASVQNATKSVEQMEEVERLTAAEFDLLDRTESSVEETQEALDEDQRTSNMTANRSNLSNSSNASNLTASPHQAILPKAKMYRKQALHQIGKAESIQRAELKELRDAEASIQKRDSHALKEVVNKMQTEVKFLQPSPKAFIY